MRTALLTAALAATLAAVAPAGASAQSTWVNAWAGFLMDPGTVPDHDSGTRWEFGSSFMTGVGVQHAFGGGLVAGLELGYSPARHEVRDLADRQVLLDEGRAHIVTAMLTGRLGGGSGPGFGTYLTGAIGTMVYGIPHLGGWDPDLALRGGGGVEYRSARGPAFFVEWSRWWTMHQSEGVQDNTVRHGTLGLGARLRL